MKWSQRLSESTLNWHSRGQTPLTNNYKHGGQQKGCGTFSALSRNINQNGTNPKDGGQLCLPPNGDIKRTKDPYTWKHRQGTMGIVHQKNNGGTGDNYTDQFDGKGENPTTTPTTPPPPSPKLQKGREKKRGKEKGGKTLTIQQQLTYVQQHNATQCTPQHIVITIAHHHDVRSYTNSTWQDIRRAWNNSVERYILPPVSPPQHSTQAHNKEGEQIQPTTPTPRKPKPNKAQIKPQTPTLPGDTV